MMNEKIFPTIIMVLNIAAAIVYATKGDIRKVAYWLAAAVLIAAITY